MGLKVKQQLFQHRGWLCLSCFSMEGEKLNLYFSKGVQMADVYTAAWWKEICVRMRYFRYFLRI